MSSRYASRRSSSSSRPSRVQRSKPPSSTATATSSAFNLTPGAPTSAAYAQQTWTFTGALTTNATVFGYYVTRVTDLDLILAESFTSFTPANNGDLINLTPAITAD